MSSLRSLLSGSSSRSGLSQLLDGGKDPQDPEEEPKIPGDWNNLRQQNNLEVPIYMSNAFNLGSVGNKFLQGTGNILKKAGSLFIEDTKAAAGSYASQMVDTFPFLARSGAVSRNVAPSAQEVARMQAAANAQAPQKVQNFNYASLLGGYGSSNQIIDTNAYEQKGKYDPFLWRNTMWKDYWGSYADEGLKALLPDGRVNPAWVEAQTNANIYLGLKNPHPMGDPYDYPWFNLGQPKGQGNNGGNNSGYNGNGGGYASAKSDSGGSISASGRSSNWMSNLATWRI